MAVQVFTRLPNCLVVGEGAAKTTGEHIRRFGDIKKVIVVTDTGMKALPLVTDLVDLLTEQGFETLLFGEVRPLPTDRNVIAAAEKMKEFGAQAVVAIGGGSAIDCARAANALYSYGGACEDHHAPVCKFNYSRNVLLPSFAIPTTAGTGSEIAAAAGIIRTDPVTGEGVGFTVFTHQMLVPDVSIIDPLMSIGLSPDLTASTGMDALTHAYEATVSSTELPLAVGLGLEAIYLVFNNLRTAVFHGDNIQARKNMAIAATTATLSFQINGLGMVHAVSEGLSAYTVVPHGIANGILLLPVMKFNAPAALDKMARIATAMGLNTYNLSKHQAAEYAIEEVKSLMRDINMPGTFTEFFTQREQMQPELYKPIKREALESTAAFALKSHFIQTNPRRATAKDISAIFEEQFAGYRFAD